MADAVVLEPECTIYQAGHLRQWLSDELQRQQALQVDLSHVLEMDCSVLQVLLWLQGEAARQGKSLQLCQPSAGVTELLHLTGLDAYLTVVEGGRDES